ncbi:hypothetical protein AB0K51_17355 [Kitasatospora sp. NPDC049285]|uniref:hypothetical protein n=1 Tax=Kitasatospora sp. NPDC049285 TaxID=3157096 RepID=UPI003446CC16
MSEPYSAMAQLHLEPEALRRYLATPVRGNRWDDWDSLTGWYDADGEARGLPYALHPEPDLSTVDHWLSDPDDDHRAQLRTFLRTAEEPELARLAYDPARATLTLVNLTVAAESFRNPLWFLALIRAATPHLDPRGGFAVVRNYIWPGPHDRHTLAALRLTRGTSRPLHPVTDAHAYQAATRAADAAFDATGLDETAGEADAVACLDRL